MTTDDKLAQRMFYAGCAFLPWLWVVNVFYFRKQVYGPLPLLDYIPGGTRREDALARFAEGDYGSDEDEDGDGPIQNLPAVGSAPSETDDETEFEDDSRGGRGSGVDDDEALLMEQMVRRDLEKWVKRSTMSATLVVGLFFTWVAVFQVYKDSFGPQWYVMSEEEGERTGW